jgi:lysophospholipase L1-like esterase
LNVTADSHCRLGVLAFGDSITNGGGELQWGVALQSWALWVARATGLPFTSYAFDGARVADVVHEQITAFERDARRPEAGRPDDPGPGQQPGTRYDVGCLYIGVNDVRAVDWDQAAFEHHFTTALSYLVHKADRTLALTAPRDLGRPRAGTKVDALNQTIRRAAAAHGALIVDLADFGARNQVMVDHVHPTAFGQIAIAERALTVLAHDGVPMKRPPASLIRYETTRWRRLRGDATYVYRHSKVSAKAAAAVIRLRAASRLRRSPRAGAGPTTR